MNDTERHARALQQSFRLGAHLIKCIQAVPDSVCPCDGCRWSRDVEEHIASLIDAVRAQ